MDPPRPLDEALDLIGRANERGIPLRLMGGLAVSYLCPDFELRAQRGQDIDLVSLRATKRQLVELLIEAGYVPDKHFNALNGHKQLYFTSPHTARAVDVVLDMLDMCHVLALRDRIIRHPITLDPADLLLSKLQIVELNAKDVHDIVYLLASLPIAEDDPQAISLSRIADVLGRDWGWYQTVTTNLARTQELIAAGSAPQPAGQHDPLEQAQRLTSAAETAPKTLRWRARGAVGTRVRWYHLPEVEAH